MNPAVILVHGAFAESSSWTDVVTKITGEGLRSHVVGVSHPTETAEMILEAARSRGNVKA